MKYLGRSVVALLACFAVGGPVWGQQSPPRTSSIQRLIAVDQLVEEKNYDDAVLGYLDLLNGEPHNPQILNRLGPSGINVLLRLSAFILMCLGIQILWNGITDLWTSTIH